MTEKETEELLVRETRTIPLPDGSEKTMSEFKLMWDTMDYLIKAYDIKMERLSELALMDCREMGYSFEDSFANVIGYVRLEYKKAFER